MIGVKQTGSAPMKALVRVFVSPCLLALLLGPSVALGEVIDDEVAHAAALSAFPAAGIVAVQDFESLPLGAALGAQLASFGLQFSTPSPTFVLPDAFGTAGQGTRLVAVGFAPTAGAELTITFDEPQWVVSAWFVDLGEDLTVEAKAGGQVFETLTVSGGGESIAGGEFAALWFSAPADEIVLSGGAAEDGFGIDDLGVALFGSVDNDGDGFSEFDGDCDDDDPTVFPGQGCGGSGDDDDSATGDDDDSATGDDDDSAGDDDDSAGDDDDSASS